MSEVPSSPARAPDQKFCGSCATLLHISAVSCPACGAQQQSIHSNAVVPVAPSAPAVQKAADQKFCVACGNIVHQSAAACPKCGAAQPGVTTKSTKSRTAAALLAIFLGGVGAHKFYIGKVGVGILYLVFFWTYIPALIGLIEGIWYFTLTDEAFDSRVVKP